MEMTARRPIIHRILSSIGYMFTVVLAIGLISFSVWLTVWMIARGVEIGTDKALVKFEALLDEKIDGIKADMGLD